jgi:hypothetical protein
VDARIDQACQQHAQPRYMYVGIVEVGNQRTPSQVDIREMLQGRIRTARDVLPRRSYAYTSTSETHASNAVQPPIVSRHKPLPLLKKPKGARQNNLGTGDD